MDPNYKSTTEASEALLKEKKIPPELLNMVKNADTIKAIAAKQKKRRKKKAAKPVTDPRLIANALRDKIDKKKKKARKLTAKMRRKQQSRK